MNLSYSYVDTHLNVFGGLGSTFLYACTPTIRLLYINIIIDYFLNSLLIVRYGVESL